MKTMIGKGKVKSSNPVQYVIINGEHVTLNELRVNVDTAFQNGLHGQFAFTPETIEALLNHIEKLNKQSEIAHERMSNMTWKAGK